MPHPTPTLLLAGLALASATAWAQTAAAPVAASGAWARASIPGQTATAAYMTLTAREPLQLVGVATPAARVAEVHEMKMDGDVMRMRAMPALDLPAGKPVQLKPGGWHLMLQELTTPLAANGTVPVTLTFRTAKGEQRQLALQVPVLAQAPRDGAPAGAAKGHEGHGGHGGHAGHGGHKH